MLLALKLAGARVLEPQTWCHQRTTVLSCVSKLVQKSNEPRVLWVCLRLLRKWATHDLPGAARSASWDAPQSLVHQPMDTCLTQKEKQALLGAWGVSCVCG